MNNEKPYMPSADELEKAEQSLGDLEKVMTEVRYEVLTDPEFEGKKIVFIMRGVPGSGKSTIAKAITPSEGAIHTTDDYFYNDQGVYEFDGNKLKENHNKNYLAFCKSLDEEKPIVVLDNTNIQRWNFENYVSAAKSKGYVVKEIPVPFPDSSVAAERNLHGVPEDAIQRMIERYEA